MPATYEPIATQTLGSDAADVTFSTIAADWTDLVLVCFVRSANAALDAGLRIQVNADTGNNYSETILYGDGSSVVSARASSRGFIGSHDIEADNATAGVFAGVRFDLMSYANTNVYKTILTTNYATTLSVRRGVGLWRSTSAITSIKVYANTGNLKTGSTISLYGLAAA